MDFSKTTQIASKLTEIVGELDLRSEEIQPYIVLKKEQLHPACQWLHESPDYYFDYLQCITAADTGPEKGILELWYHLNSIPFGINLILKVELPRGDEEKLPEIDTLSDIWKTADWHEREAFDLVGVKFKNHPDLRRILLPADWVGHPLRKDHVEQELYHSIKIKY